MVRKFPNLCAPIEIGDLKIRNRMFSAPMSHPNITSEGLITPEMMNYYELRAKGGAGVVTVSEAVTHFRTGKSHARNVNLEADYVILGLAETARLIKRHGSVASMELDHGGMCAGADARDKSSINEAIKYGPSATTLNNGQKVLEMPKELIDEIVTSFGMGAAKCKQAGFDMIMLHGGHGWLIQQFLSPSTNKRKDEYGGSLENRARIALEILDSIREAVGPAFPIEFRMSAEEYIDEGYFFPEAIEFAKLIESRIDLLHVSTGNLMYHSRRTHPTMFDGRGCNVHYAAEMKKHVKIPVATIGALADPAMMEEIIASGKADVVYMARALQADPYLPRKVMQGKEEDITPCILCNLCFAERAATKSRICAVNPMIGREVEADNIRPVEKPKKVLVAGGGLSGMQAALTAAKRGHKVVLCEKTDELGGALKCEKYIPFKLDIIKLIESKAREMQNAGVEVRLRTEVTIEYTEKEAPDTLLVAIGAKPIVPDLEGIERPNVLMAEEATEKADAIGQHVAILGGGLVGCELGVFLANTGRNVTIIEMTDMLATNSNSFQRMILTDEIKSKTIVKLGMKGIRVTDAGIICADENANEELIKADTVICSIGQQSLYPEAKQLMDCAPEVFLIGDCLRPQNIREAIFRGYHAGMDI